MKKIVSFCLAALLTMLCLSLTVLADESHPTVQVTVSDENGNVVLANEKITLDDADGDGSLTVTDALLLAHAEGCPDGFAYTDDYGEREITSLWGFAGGTYGCFVNGASFYLLTDELWDEDTVHAFVYRGGEELSDAYSYFSKETLSFKNGKDELALYVYTLTEEGNLRSVPLKGAEITVNGEKTGIKTDKDGRFTILADKLDPEKKNVISAVYGDMLIVPPVLTAEIGAVHAQRGVSPIVIVFIVIAVAAVCGAGVAVFARKRKQ